MSFLGISRSPIVGTEFKLAPETTDEATPPSLSEELAGAELTEEVAADTDDTAIEETEEVEVSTDFAAQFESIFGVKTEEAVEVVRSLQVFKDEMFLMREWGTSPAEYDKRMLAVREFYETLPEDGKGKFNSVEGAKAIWEHIAGNQPKRTKSASPQSAGKLRSTAAPKQQTFKKSEILRMTDAEYRSKLPAITKAYQAGAILEDI
jgi:hypothetical protein